MTDGDPKGLKVLIIEDSQDCAELLKHMLHKLRRLSEIKVAGSGEEGIEFLEKEGAKDKSVAFLPDLIFQDLNLPGQQGLETLSKIKNNPLFRSIPVIVLTASQDKQDIVESYRKGGTIFMRKPLDENFLTEILSRMMLAGVFRK